MVKFPRKLRRYLWPDHLGRQAMLAVVLLISATTFVFSWHVAEELREEVASAFQRYAVATSRNLANHIAYPVLNGDLEGAQQELVAELGTGQADEAYLYNAQGELLFKILGARVAQRDKGAVPGVSLPESTLEPSLEYVDGDLSVWVPVGGDQVLAWLRVTYRPGIDASARDLALYHLFEALLVALGATLLTGFLLRRPVASITKAAQFAERLDVSRGDVLGIETNTVEIRYLYEALNRASKKLHDQAQEVEESRHRLARAQQVAGLEMWEWDAVGEVLYWSNDMSNISQTPAENIEEAFTQEVLAKVSEADRKQVFDALFNVLNGGDSVVVDHHVMSADDEHSIVRLHIDVERNSEGEVVRVIGISQDVSERYRVEEELRSSEAQTRTILNSVQDAIVTIDYQGVIQTFNQSAELIFGYEGEEIVGQNISILMADEVKESHAHHVKTYQPGKGRPLLSGREFVAKRKDGTFFPVEINISDVRVNDQVFIVGIIRDITLRKQAEENMRLSEQVFANSVEGIVVADKDKKILRANFSFSNITGYLMSDFACKGLDCILDSQTGHAASDEIWRTVQRDGQWKGEVQGSRKNGERYLAWMAIVETKDSGGNVTHYIVVINDISEIKEAQTRIHHLANFDSLTNLPNRSLFQDRLIQGVAQAARSDKKLALLRVDLDRFKTLNETMGHGSGDQLLKCVAERLNSVVRKCDTVGRLSGDEYALMLTNLGTDKDAAHVSRKILSVFESPFEVAGQEVYVTASIGVALYPNDADNADDLIKHAGAAMHHVKDHGRNAYRFYTGDLDASAFEHLVLENSLRRALGREEFVLFYQPQLDLNSGKIIGVEALIRWNHPDLGMVSPAQFIPLLEETGLILPVGDWVLHTACQQAQAWMEAGFDFVRMAVNLSPRQIDQTTLVDTVAEALNSSGLDPRRLDLEITESSLMSDVEQSVRMLSELQQMKVNISIDDFGTGYSSLSYLTRFPINTLKIDRSFVKDVTDDMDDANLARAIITMGHSLKLKVLAEGVETPEQLEFLRQHGCDEVQGFLFSKPLPAEEVVSLFDSEMRSLLCVNDQ